MRAGAPLLTLTVLFISALIITGCNEKKAQLDPKVHYLDFTNASPQLAGKFQFSDLKFTNQGTGLFLDARLSNTGRVEKFEVTVGGHKQLVRADGRFMVFLKGITEDQAREVGIRYLGESTNDESLGVYKRTLFQYFVSSLFLGLFGLLRRWNNSSWKWYIIAVMLGPIAGGIVGFGVGIVLFLILGLIFLVQGSDPTGVGALGMVLTIGGVILGPIVGPWIVYGLFSRAAKESKTG